jgi:cytochrome c oxidase assembly factor CtaG
VAITGPAGSVSLFCAVVLITHIPAVYGLALANDHIHEAEHALYLLSAMLVWAPLLGVDPLPHRPGPRGAFMCMVACMVPMVALGVWLALAPDQVYGRYVAALGPAALHDQRVAAVVMLVGCLPAFVALALVRIAPAARLLTPAESGTGSSFPAVRSAAPQ